MTRIGSGPGRSRQTQVYVRGLGGERPAVPVAPERLQAAAQARLNATDFAYIAGGAGAERTMRANLAAFERVRLLPRQLSGSRDRNLSVELLGHTLATPLLLAPIGVLEAAHPEADLAVARAAAAEGVPFVFSSQASVPMEDCAAAMGDSPRWFQLYWGTDDEVTRSFVRRAEACGAKAIVLTLDTTLLGWRPRDLCAGAESPSISATRCSAPAWTRRCLPPGYSHRAPRPCCGPPRNWAAEAAGMA